MHPLPPDQQAQIKKGQQTALIVWLAILSSTVLMLLIVHLALQPEPSSPQEEVTSANGLLRLLPLVFGLESLLLVGFSLWTRYRLLQLQTSRREPTIQELVRGWVVTLILSFALAEAIAQNNAQNFSC